MRITQVISDGNVGGAGILLSRITDALKDRFDFEILLPETSALRARLPRNGVKITPFPFSADRSFRMSDALAFARYFRRTKPDIVHTHAALSARVGGALAGVPVLLSTRHCAGAEVLGGLRTRLYNAVTTLTVSTAAAATRQLSAAGIAKGRIATVPNGSPALARLPEDSRLRLRRALGFSDGAFVLGNCARMEPVKGQDTLLRAMALLSPRYPDVRLLLVGDGSKRESLETLTARLGLCRAVRFVGYTAAPDVYENLFDLNINPSRGTETSSLVTSECMSLGIPTVASDFGGNPDMVEDGTSGLIFPRDNPAALAHAVEKILDGRPFYEKLKAGAAAAWKNRFSLDRMAEDYTKIYASFS